MKRITLLLVLLASPVFADDIRLATGVTGTAAITFFVDENNVVQIDRTKPILVGSIGTTPDIPDEPPTPIPPVVGPLDLKVWTLVAKAPAGTAEINSRKTLTELFKMTGELPLTDPKDIHKATTILFDAMPMSAAWKKWKSDADTFSAALTLADTKRTWQLISEGLAK